MVNFLGNVLGLLLLVLLLLALLSTNTHINEDLQMFMMITAIS